MELFLSYIIPLEGIINIELILLFSAGSFSAGFREASSHYTEITISDCSHSAFLTVMEYIYTGKLPKGLLDPSAGAETSPLSANPSSADDDASSPLLCCSLLPFFGLGRRSIGPRSRTKRARVQARGCFDTPRNRAQRLATAPAD